MKNYSFYVLIYATLLCISENQSAPQRSNVEKVKQNSTVTSVSKRNDTQGYARFECDDPTTEDSTTADNCFTDTTTTSENCATTETIPVIDACKQYLDPTTESTTEECSTESTTDDTTNECEPKTDAKKSNEWTAEASTTECQVSTDGYISTQTVGGVTTESQIKKNQTVLINILRDALLVSQTNAANADEITKRVKEQISRSKELLESACIRKQVLIKKLMTAAFELEGIKKQAAEARCKAHQAKEDTFLAKRAVRRASWR